MSDTYRVCRVVRGKDGGEVWVGPPEDVDEQELARLHSLGISVMSAPLPATGGNP